MRHVAAVFLLALAGAAVVAGGLIAQAHRDAAPMTIEKVKDERPEYKPNGSVKKITGRIGIRRL